MAGRIQQSGRIAMLVPRELGSSMTGASVPLPPAKPGPSLASYAFRPPASRAKSEPSPAAGSFRPATLHPLVSPQARPEPSQVAARATLPAPAKGELPRIAAHTLPPNEQPPPARPRPSQVAARMLRPAMLHPVEPPSAKHEASQVAARAIRPATLQPIAPAQTKREPSRVAAHAPHPEEPPPPAKPRPSQLAARTLHSIAPPPAARSEPSETGTRVFRPAALAAARPGSSQVALHALQPVANLTAQEAWRGSLGAAVTAHKSVLRISERKSPVH